MVGVLPVEVGQGQGQGQRPAQPKPGREKLAPGRCGQQTKHEARTPEEHEVLGQQPQACHDPNGQPPPGIAAAKEPD